MKKIIFGSLIGLSVLACNQAPEDTKVALAQEVKSIETSNNMELKTIHTYKTTTLSGETFDLATLKGKRILIVNTASECGFTPQYEQLEELYETYKDKGFVVLGFPSNDFGKQEPGSDKEIAAFCKKNYGVSFPMMTKAPVSGDNMQEIYQWLTSKALNGKEDVEVNWNFNKFLVNEAGEWVAYFGSKTSPLDAEILTFAKGNL